MRMGPASEDRGISILSEILKHKGEGTPPYAKIWGGRGYVYISHTHRSYFLTPLVNFYHFTQRKIPFYTKTDYGFCYYQLSFY